MTIDKVYLAIADFTSKVVGGYISPTQFNLYAEIACMAVMRKYFPKEPGGIRYASDERISNDLRTLKKVVTLTTNSSGQITIPTDYYHVAKITAEGYGIEIIEIYQEDERVNSHLDPVTITDRIAVQYDTYFQIYPVTNALSVSLTYIRKPTTPVYAYTLSGGRPMYDSGGSTQHDFQNLAEIDFMQEIIRLVAPHLKDADLLQFSGMVKQEQQ
jgi:hypothetical protein